MGPVKHLALVVLGAAPSWTLVPSAQEPVWPMANGSHEVLHSFQNPFSYVLDIMSFRYFHQGVDLRGELDEVVAMRSGIVRYAQGDPNGLLLVEVQTPHGVEADDYRHLLLDPWQVGDAIQAGDVVGVVSDRAFVGRLRDHVHIDRFDGWAGGIGMVPGGTNLLHPLMIFAEMGDRDPQLLAAAPEDANRDGVRFHVAPHGGPTVRLPYAFGAVELLLEATDRQSSTLSWNQGLVGVGYWVESRAGGGDVASAAEPYRLVRFDDSWRSSHRNCDSLLRTVMVDAPNHLVDYGSNDTGWHSLATYRLTNSAGFQGSGADVSALQAWVTDARLDSGTANGTGAWPAREIHEARFPDGRYLVHALTEDLVHEVDTVFRVVVDNYRPYVEAVHVLDARTGAPLYRARWVFERETGELRLERTISNVAPRLLRPGDALRIEVEFSEPMASAALVAVEPALGPLPVLVSRQEPDGQTLWSAKLEVVRIPTGTPRLQFAGVDLAGSTLFGIHSPDALSAPFNKRENAAPLDDPTRDTLHVVPLDVRRLPALPDGRR